MRTFNQGEQVFVITESPLCHPATPWCVGQAEPKGYRCWRHDGNGGRIWQVFASDELETVDERNARGAEHDRLADLERDRIMIGAPRSPLYPV